MRTQYVKMASEQKKLKGILKTSSSFDKGETSDPKRREMKWDEMNILATFHPADKDYGHKKIDEPPTPYSKLNEEQVSEGEEESLDPDSLADRLSKGSPPRIRQTSISSEEDEEETEEERATRKLFEQKRKLHYNEFHAAKLARQLMAEEEDEEEDAEVENKDENQAEGSSEVSQ